jgi:hypothetical protein
MIKPNYTVQESAANTARRAVNAEPLYDIFKDGQLLISAVDSFEVRQRGLEVPFEVNSGLAIQAAQLARWGSVLKKTAFERLVVIATKDNAKAKTGHDVLRGVDIDMIVHNQLMSR